MKKDYVKMVMENKFKYSFNNSSILCYVTFDRECDIEEIERSLKEIKVLLENNLMSNDFNLHIVSNNN